MHRECRNSTELQSDQFQARGANALHRAGAGRSTPSAGRERSRIPPVGAQTINPARGEREAEWGLLRLAERLAPRLDPCEAEESASRPPPTPFPYAHRQTASRPARAQQMPSVEREGGMQNAAAIPARPGRRAPAYRVRAAVSDTAHRSPGRSTGKARPRHRQRPAVSTACKDTDIAAAPG